MRWFLLPVALLLGASAPPRATVYVFLAPTCPISQAVTPELRVLYAQYSAQRVAFVGVFDEMTTATEIAAFGRDYQLKFPLKADLGELMAHGMSATITPEAAVVDKAGTLVYRGRISDLYVRLGVRRTVVLHHELADALAALTAGRPVAVPRTEAVGCLIEFSPD